MQLNKGPYFAVDVRTADPAGLRITQALYPPRTRLPRHGHAQPYLCLVAAGGFVWFVASDAASGSELRRTDGTAAGTVLVADLGPGSTTYTALAPFGSSVLFAAQAAARDFQSRWAARLGFEVMDGVPKYAFSAACTTSCTRQALRFRAPSTPPRSGRARFRTPNRWCSW